MWISIKLLIFSESRKRKLNLNGRFYIQIKILAQWKFLKNTIQTNYCNISKAFKFCIYVKLLFYHLELKIVFLMMSTYKINKNAFCSIWDFSDVSDPFTDFF